MTLPSIKSYLNFERPALLLAIFLVLSGAVWVIHTSLLQNILPLDVVEAVVWGNQLQWGQMKSPPLSGYLAGAFWHLSGGSDWSLYLLAQLSTTVGLYFSYKIAREFVDEYEATTATMLLCFLCYYNPPAMKFCSHYTQEAFLPAMTLFFVRAWRDNRLTDWLLLALFSALAILGKYSAVQLLLAFGIVMLATKTGRQRLASYKIYAAAVAALVLLLPHIVWLFQHDFLAVTHMQDRLQGSGSDRHFPLRYIPIMFYPYFSCAGILLLAMLPWRNARREPTPNVKGKLQLLLPIALIPPGIYVILSIFGQALVEQWFSYFAYLSGLVVVLALPFRSGKREFKRIFIGLNAFIVILLIATAIDVLVKPRWRIHTEPRAIVVPAETFWQKHSGGKHPLQVAYGDRYLAGVLELYSASHPSACDKDDICAWELVKEKVNQNGLLLVSRYGKMKSVKFLPDLREADILWERCTFNFRAKWGKSKTQTIWFGYIPPRPER